MKRILFIEDDPILGPVYETQLKAAGYAVTRATDGEAGLSALQVNLPDLIVLDIVIPRISGIELLQIIRTTPRTSGIPVVVFTNSFETDVLEKVRQIGATRLLSKSHFVPREVVAVIGELLTGAAGSGSGDGAPTAAGDAEAFRQRVATALAPCRALLVRIAHETSGDARLPKLRSLRASVRQLTSLTSAADLRGQAYFCEALEAFLGELCEQPGRTTDSGLRTLTQAVDFLFEKVDPSQGATLPDNLAFRVLVVDDDPISRRAVQVALGRIKQQAVECGSAKEAIAVCADGKLDLIFLDVDMGEITGFELCSQIRKSESNRTTPVIFVTGHTDFQSRAQSSLSGGDDFIGKPFHFMELAVKTLLHLLRAKSK